MRGVWATSRFAVPGCCEGPTMYLSTDCYLILRHGQRRYPLKFCELGQTGPILGPVGISWCYGCVRVHDQALRRFEILPMRGDVIDYDGCYYPTFDIVGARDLRVDRLDVAGSRVHRFDTIRDRIAAGALARRTAALA